MKKIMGLIIGASLGVTALAQNTNMNNGSMNNNSSTNITSPYGNYGNNNYNVSPGTVNPANPNPGSPPGTNTTPGSMTPSTGNSNMNTNTYGNTNTYDQSSNRYNQQPQQQIPSDVRGGSVQTGDSLLRYPNSNPNLDQTVPGVTPSTGQPSTNPSPGGRESGYNYSVDTSAAKLAQVIMPDPKTKKSKRSSSEMSPENVARKQEDKTAHALPNNYRIPSALKPAESSVPNLAANPSASEATVGCSLNDELTRRQGAFKDRRMVGEGELLVERAKDGDEKIKYTDNQEYYRYEKNRGKNEKFSYGVTKDYETMELRKMEDGTAEIVYQGIFPNIEAAQDAVANGIIIKEMGNVCKLDFSQK